LLEQLLTEQPNPASEGIDRKSTSEILRTINAEDQRVAASVTAEIEKISSAVDAIVERTQRGLLPGEHVLDVRLGGGDPQLRYDALAAEPRRTLADRPCPLTECRDRYLWR